MAHDLSTTCTTPQTDLRLTDTGFQLGPRQVAWTELESPYTFHALVQELVQESWITVEALRDLFRLQQMRGSEQLSVCAQRLLQILREAPYNVMQSTKLRTKAVLGAAGCTELYEAAITELQRKGLVREVPHDEVLYNGEIPAKGRKARWFQATSSAEVSEFAEQLLKRLHGTGRQELSKTDIQKVVSRNIKGELLDEALAELTAQGHLTSRVEKGVGRPTTYYRLHTG